MGTSTEEMENGQLNMAGMTVVAEPWSPETGRDPTSEELSNYFLSPQRQQPDAAGEPPAEITGPYTAPDPAAEPVPVAEPWSPESGRDPTSEELAAFYVQPEPPPPPAELTREEKFRKLPGLLSEEARAALEPIIEEQPIDSQLTANEPPLIEEPEIEPWDPQTGVEPTPEQLREFTGLEAGDTPMRAVAVNPVNVPLRTNTDVGVIRSTLDNVVQGAATLMASVPKTVQLWFAPDTDLVGWMDEMDRLDADPDAAKMDKVNHIVSGRQRFGTVANVFTSGLVDAYISGPKNKGKTLTENRRKARNQLMEELRKTVDKPLYRAGEAFDQIARETFPTNPDLQDKWYSKVANGLGSVVGYMATFAITKKLASPLAPEVMAGTKASAVVGGTGTAALGVTVQQSFAFEAALEGGAEIDTAFEAMYAGETFLSGASEAIPISRFFTRADQASGGAIKKTLVRMMKQGTEEGLQEGFQQIMENLTAQRLYDPERNLWTGTQESTALGFSTGALVEFLASLFVPGRIRGTTDRGVGGTGELSLDEQMAAAREAAGADPLDQAQAEAETFANNAERLAATKARLQAQQEARIEGGVQEPLAGLIQAESDLARLPFEARAEAVMEAVAEEVALAKTAAFEEAETEKAATKEAEVTEAEYQKELQVGEAQEELGVRQEAAEEIQAEVTAPTIGEAIEPEARAGLEKMQAALKVKRETAEAEAAAEPVEVPTPQLALEDTRADFEVTPEGEVIPKAEQGPRVPREPSLTAEEIGPDLPALPGERAPEETAAIIDAKADQAATSEANDKPMPTEAQLESGQYQKGELGPRDVGMPGVNVAVETAKGSTRRGTRADGSTWSQKMRDHYGYIRGTESAEGPTEQLDAFIGDNLESDMIFVVDQVNNTGEFDEHKVMIGYTNQMDAVRAYKRNYPKGQKVGPVIPMTKEQFSQWLERGDQTQAITRDLREGQQVLAGEEEFEAIVSRQKRKRGKKPVVRYRAEEGAAEERIALPHKEALKRIPELQAAAQRLTDGEITAAEYDELVNQYKPFAPYKEVPAPATEEEMFNALHSNKREKIGKGETLEDGHKVGLRLDIPAYKDHNVWAPTIHEGEPGKGKGPIAHEATAVITDATFPEDTKALKVAAGAGKMPSAVIKGSWKKQSEAETMAEAEAALTDPNWVQVGFDPEKHSYFFDRASTNPVVGGSKVIQVGGLVLVQNPVFGEKSDFRFRAEATETFDFENMSKANLSSFMVAMTETMDNVEAREMLKQVREGNIEAIETPEVQAWIRSKARPNVVQVKEARDALKPITDELVGLKPKILGSPADLKDQTLLRAIKAAGAMKAKGVFYNGQLYVFANNHESTADVVRTLLHEGVAHKGLRVLFKNEAELNDILDEVYASMTEEQVNALRSKHAAYANIDLNTLEGQREMAEEHIAELAESDPQQTVIQQLIAKVRSMLRQAGMDVQWTNDDITNLLADTRRELRKTVPLSRITVVSEVEVSETGEVVEVEEQADVALRQLTKRVSVIQQLRECQA